jgi:serine/threonine protein kinase/DNA-binding response OmpR family regulator/outer membrane biosynthesis protein TonB
MKKNILVVEYDNPTVDSIKEILSHPLFNITVAAEGQVAKEYLKKENYNMVITAAMLPKFHGFNLSQYIKEQSPATFVVIISSIYKEIEYKHQAITQYKADDFFEKPVKKELFKKRILELLNIRESELVEVAGPTTTPMPTIDTAQLKTVKKMAEEKSKFTSDDLFGDIIEKIEHTPTYEINLDNGKQPEAAAPPPPPPSPEKEKGVSGQAKKTDDSASQITNKRLVNVLQEEGKSKDTARFKKIEEDISKKFEETLSGLGIKPSSPAPKAAAPAPAAENNPAGKGEELGNYDILGLIARGGMAEIYKAKKKGVKGFEKVIAIKKILSGYGEDDKYIEMFVDEAKIAAELSHPNIVQIYDLGKKDDYYFIAMEYVNGKDLRIIMRKLLELKQPFPEELAVLLISKILEALSYAHSAKDSRDNNLDIVHRDISPPNILISFNGEVKLTDFGVSKASNKMHQTLSGALKGKLLYMSPEQARGEKDVDYRADLYSVGAILYELLTGQKLFLDTSEMGILKKVQQGIVSRPSEIKPDIDPELERILLKALDRDIEERYQNAAAMVKDLDAYLQSRFDHMPAAVHVSHFVYRIFKKEIADEGIKLNLKPLPYTIRRVSKPTPPPPFLDIEEEEVSTGKTSDTQEIDTAAEEADEAFAPTIEIELDSPAKVEEEDDAAPPRTEIELPPLPTEAADATLPEEPPRLPEIDDIELELENLEKQGKKRGRLWLFIFIVVGLAAAAFYYYYFHYLPGSSAPPQTPPAISETAGQEESDGEEPVTSETQEIDEKSDIAAQETAASTPVTPIDTRPKPTPKTTPKPPTTKTVEKQAQIEQPVIKGEEKPTTEIKAESAADSEKPDQPAIEEAKEQAPPPEEKREEPPKPETVTISEGMIVADVDTQPVPISNPMPKISRKLRRALKASQTVIISYLVDHNGKIERIKFLRKSTIPELDMQISNTVYTWTFKPATKDNKRVKIWMSKPITIKK